MELAKLDRIEREAWAAWEWSPKPQQSAVILDDGAQQPTRKMLKNQNGDPRSLELAMKCVAARRAILGLARRSHCSTPERRASPLQSPLSHLTNEQLELNRVIFRYWRSEKDAIAPIGQVRRLSILNQGHRQHHQMPMPKANGDRATTSGY